MVNTPGFTQTKVLIIGGGISGICMGVELLTKYNIKDIVIVEQSGGFGGTWRDNIYPGCACDVFSQLYSFSWEKNSHFTRLLPGQQEILDYLTDVAQKNGLYKYARFNTSAKKLVWNEDEMKWYVEVGVDGGKDSEYAQRYTIVSDFVITAIGQTNLPKGYDMTGLNDFRGKVMHSARWDRGYDLKGKRVAIIGTGSTAAQIIPEIAKEVGHLTVCQRSPGFVIPRHDHEISAFQRTLITWVPPLAKRMRAEMMNFREMFHTGVTQAQSHPADVMRAMNDGLVQKQLAGRPDLQEKVKPRYNPGCKRTVISSEFYPTLMRPNVDLETASIERVTEDGIRFEGASDSKPFDTIILATGFQTFLFLKKLEIVGRNGRTLADIWPDDIPKVYRGIMTPDLPNLGILYGPNTNLTHNSLILAIEAQARCLSAIMDRVFQAQKNNTSRLSLRPKVGVTERYCQEVQKRLQNTSFADDSCTSWWKRDDGLILNNWPGTAVEYQKLMENIDWDDFEFDGSSATSFAEGVQKQSPQKVPRVVEEAWLSRGSIAAIALGSVAACVSLARIYRHLNLRRL